MNTFTSIGAKLGLDISDFQKGLARAQTQAQEFSIKSQQLLRQGGLRGPARLLGIAGPIYALIGAYRLTEEEAKKLQGDETKAFDERLAHVQKIVETSKDGVQVAKEWASLEDFSKNIDPGTESALKFSDSIDKAREAIGKLSLKFFGGVIQAFQTAAAVYDYAAGNFGKVGTKAAHGAFYDQLNQIDISTQDDQNDRQRKIYEAAAVIDRKEKEKTAEELAKIPETYVAWLKTVNEEEESRINLLKQESAALLDANEKSLRAQDTENEQKLKQLSPASQVKVLGQLVNTLFDSLTAAKAGGADQGTIAAAQDRLNRATARYDEAKKANDEVNSRLKEFNKRNRAEYEPSESQFISGEVGSSRDRAILQQADAIKRRAQTAYAGGYTSSGDYYAGQAEKLRGQVHSRESEEKQVTQEVFVKQMKDIGVQLESIDEKLTLVQVN